MSTSSSSSTAKRPPTSSTSTPLPLALGNPKQQLAALVSQSLKGITPQDAVTVSNYASWSSEIQNGLASLFFDHYLTSNKAESGNNAATKATNEVIRRCLVSWLLWQMDVDNCLRFEPSVTKYLSNGPISHPMPARLWKALDTYYASRTEETKMILNSRLSNLKEGPLDLKTHLIKFHEAVHAFRLASGVITEDDLGRKLLMSMNNFKEARTIANMGIISYTNVILELWKRINTAKMLVGPATTVVKAKLYPRGSQSVPQRNT